MSTFVVIEHPDGRSYAVLPENFHRLYAAEGFRIVGEEHGTGSIPGAVEVPASELAPAPADAPAPVVAPV